MPDGTKLYLSKADGELFVVPAASEDAANAVMDLAVQRQGMLGHTPCELIPSAEVDGKTYWQVPA